ncbi:MAG: ATP-binding protein, partial [bacterium]
QQVLFLCLAPELDPTFERLYAYVQNDVSRKYPTPHLALTLFAGDPRASARGDRGEDRLAARNSFLTDAPLRRFRLVALDHGSLPGTAPGARPLRLDDRIIDYVCGVNRLDERVADFLMLLPVSLPSPAHLELVDRLQRWVEAEAKRRTKLTLNLIGPQGAGKRAVARAICDRLGLHLCGLNAIGLPVAGPERRDMLRLLERDGILSRLAFYIDATETDRADKVAMTVLSDLIERLGAFLVIGSRERWETGSEILVAGVPKPDANAQCALWRQALAEQGHSLNGQIEGVVQQFDFGPIAIHQTVAAARARARLRDPHDRSGVTTDDLWQACREQAAWRLDELAQRIVPCHTWEDIVLPDDILRQLQEIAAQVAKRAHVYEQWGFGARLSRGRGISALFSGPSGTGKTMAAEILAHDLKLDLYRIDLAGVVSKYIGETEKNLRKVFDAAEQSGAILFFDEADALFGKRSEVKDSHDRYANIEISYLLQRMEDYRGLAILATNMKSHLDQAFLRRLRFLVDFPFPGSADRQRIWQKVFPSQAPVEGLDYVFLSRLEIAGGNIKNIALNAAFLAAKAAHLIRMEHVLRAAKREYAKIDKLISESEFGSHYAKVKR